MSGENYQATGRGTSGGCCVMHGSYVGYKCSQCEIMSGALAKRREQIATAILAGMANQLFVGNAKDEYLANHIHAALIVADALIEEIDNHY